MTMPRSVTNVKPSVDALKALTNYLEEMRLYREQRNRPTNRLYYIAKMAEEVREAAEAAVALEGSRRKIAKLKAEGVEPIDRLKEELADVVNTAMLCAEWHGINPEELLARGTEKMAAKRTKNG
jgi:NTP pyrophosphatase (non-canonical NTP hydrolase)